jgi:hypothetical protein
MRCTLRGGRLSSLLVIVFGLAAPSVQAGVIPSGVDVWFSSSTPMVSFKNGFKYLGPGSVLSTTGQVIATNQQLLAAFQPRFNIPADRGLDALAIAGTATDKTIVFSTNRTFYSNALHRSISDGDLITNRGEVIATNQQLLAAFNPKGAHFGLDAAFVESLDGPGGPEVLFSTTKSFYSNALAKWITPGDILSNQGQIIKTAAELLSAFSPKDPAAAIGIDGISVTAVDGNVTYWFSTNKDFYSNSLKRTISQADLLSSDGKIAMTQQELTRSFGFVYPICGSLTLDAATFSVEGEPPLKPTPYTPEPTTVSLLLIASLMGVARRKH